MDCGHHQPRPENVERAMHHNDRRSVSECQENRAKRASWACSCLNTYARRDENGRSGFPAPWKGGIFRLNSGSSGECRFNVEFSPLFFGTDDSTDPAYGGISVSSGVIHKELQHEQPSVMEAPHREADGHHVPDRKGRAHTLPLPAGNGKYNIAGKPIVHPMLTVSSAEFQRNFGAFLDVAAAEPLAVTSHGRTRVVILPAADYRWMSDVARAVAADVQACRAIGDFLADLAAGNEASGFGNQAMQEAPAGADQSGEHEALQA
jgi:prevent-host-death family protein